MKIMSPSQQPAVRLQGISKSFGRTLAVDNVSLHLYPGEVLGLVGGNGSGKSTLMKVLSGHLKPDTGEILVNGRRVEFSHPSQALRTGISMLSQFPAIFSGLDVTENIFLGQELRTRPALLGNLDRKRMRTTAHDLLSVVSSEAIPLDQPVGTLSGGQQKAVALARLMAQDSGIMIFDEPNASLGLQQKENTARLIMKLKADGRAVVLITHDLHELQASCDRVIGMIRGSLAPERLVNELSEAQLSNYMLGSLE